MRGLLLYAAWFDFRVATGDQVCAFMQADSSCEMFARPPKGQEREGWFWRLQGAMNGMRTASRDFTEFLAGILTERMDFKRGKLERCLFVHESSETRVVSRVGDPLIGAKPATLEKILDTDHEIGGDQVERSSQSTSTCNLPGIRVPKCTRWRPQRIHSETYCQVR